MTPEQTIGSVLAAVDRIRRHGIRTRRLSDQLAGSLAMDQLRDAGYVVVKRSEWVAVTAKAEKWIRTLTDAPTWATCECGRLIFRHDAWSHQGGTPDQDHEATPVDNDAA